MEKRKRIPVFEKELVFLDLETTGLDPNIHEIIEIAIVNLNGDVLINSKLKPLHIERAQPEALYINGYSEEKWADAPLLSEMADQIASCLKDKIVAGHNVSFDLSFVKSSLSSVDKELLSGIGYHKVDTATLAFAVLKNVESLSLMPLCQLAGIEIAQAHRALDDIQATRKLYIKLMENVSQIETF
jgi:DNA polymerase III epsilon subunit-like protein